jgi:hypothetical protein
VRYWEGAMPMLYVVIFMCLRIEPLKCEIWNMDYPGISWKGCKEWAEAWQKTSGNIIYEMKHVRCSLNKVEPEWLQ